ncbi:MAG TPA: polysaccharide biosynthesis C-terminal domain-containing protein [Chitinophagales bacterium]|nr:polysaccharide biosynthesis C-terminal domain-containing protein [Chitinophagales bacterium]
MNPIKRLASQTVVYGLSSILGRFLNYLMVPLYTYYFTKYEYGVVSEFYAYTGFLATLLVFGLETGFFRFGSESENKEKVYSTALNFIVGSNALFVLLIVLFITPLSKSLKYPDHHEYFFWFAIILALDSVAAIPFARLRQENKPLRFATIKFIEIGANVLLNLFFILVCKRAFVSDPSSFFGSLYNPAIGVGYIFIANLIASALKLLLLTPQLKGIWNGIDKEVLKKMLAYSLPMVVIGFAGIINEMLDRVILKYLLPYDDVTNMEMLGVYGACYKLSILMTLFIQAFRYAAEPFFFAQAKEKGSTKVYADVMKYFVIVCVTIFLLVTLYLDLFKGFIGPAFRVGLPVVPILLLANLFLGVYVNLSIWYKLTDKTMLGAFVSIGGAVITVIINVLFIPKYGYMASAWATLACYGSMALVSYLLGQKYYPVEYSVKSFVKYFAAALAIYFGFIWLNEQVAFVKGLPPFVLSTVLMLLFLAYVWLEDGRQLVKAVRK